MPTLVKIANIKGPKGNDVQNPRLSGDDLLIDEINRSTGTPVTTIKNVGNVRGRNGDSYANARVTESGSLLIDRTTPTGTSTVNVGVVRGAQGLPGTNATPTADAIAQNLSLPGVARDALRDEVGIISGVIDDDTTDNRAAIQAALDQGGRWRLPPTSGRYLVNGALEIPVAGTELVAHGAPIRQGTAGQALFNIAVADVKIDGVDAIGATSTLNVTGMTAAWEMSVVSSRWTAINAYSGANRLNIPWIRGRGFSSVVRVTSWDRALGASGALVEDVALGKVLCSNVEFGIVIHGTRRFSYKSVDGSYLYPIGGTRPPHLVYFSGSNDTNFDVNAGPATASYEGGAGGQAFQFKGITRGAVGALIANGCPGVLNIMECRDVHIQSIVSRGDTVTGVDGSVTLDAVGVQERIKIGRIAVSLVNNAVGVSIGVGDRVDIDEIDIEVSHTTSAIDYDIKTRGTNTRIGVARVRNSGPNSWRGVGLFSGAGHRVERFDLRNMRIAIDVRASATGAVLGYNPDDITLHPTDGVAKLLVAAAAAPSLRLPQRPTSPLVKVEDRFSIAPESGVSFGPALTGQTWTVGLGTWVSDTIVGEVRESASASGANAYIDAGVGNVQITADVLLTGYVGVIMRRISATEYVAAYFNASGGTVAKRDGGSLTPLTTGAALTLQNGRWYRMRAEIFGPKVALYVDDVLVVSHTLSGGDEVKFDVETVHGLFSSVSGGTSRFRDFRVRQL